MAFLKKLLGRKGNQPGQRVRVCSQCGMPVDQHKDWCSILNGQKSVDGRPAEAVANE